MPRDGGINEVIGAIFVAQTSIFKSGADNWSGSNTSAIATSSGGWLAVGTTGNGRLNITCGRLTRYDVGIGGATTVGAVYQSGGSLTVQRVANTGDFWLCFLRRVDQPGVCSRYQVI